MGDEPLLDALDEGKHEWSRNEEAVQRRDSREHRAAKAPRVASTEAGRGSVDMVMPPAGASVGSSSAEAQARMPTDLPVSLHSRLLSWPSARLPVPMAPASSSSSTATATTAAAGGAHEASERLMTSVAKGASLPNSPGLSPALLYALAADVDLPPFTLQPSDTTEHPTSMPLGDLLESQAAPSTGWRPSPRSQAPPEFTEAFLQEHALAGGPPRPSRMRTGTRDRWWARRRRTARAARYGSSRASRPARSAPCTPRRVSWCSGCST